MKKMLETALQNRYKRYENRTFLQLVYSVSRSKKR